MRVLLVSHDFLPNHPSGTEIYTGELGHRLAERGHEVHVFTTEKDVGRPHLSLSRREWEGLPVHELVNNLFYEDFRETWDWPPAREAFGGVLDELAPDVVHVMHLMNLSVECVEEAHRRTIPVFFTLHDFWLQCPRFGQRLHPDGSLCATIDFERCGGCLATLAYNQTPLARRTARALAALHGATGLDLAPAARGAVAYLKSRSAPGEWRAPDPEKAREMAAAARERDAELRRRLLPCVRRFFAPSRFLRSQLVDWGIPEERIDHLPNGIEPERFAGFERKPADELRVVYLGTLAPHKAPHVLLEAWGAIPAADRAGARLSLIGPGHDPEYVAALEREAERVGAAVRGAVAREEVPDVLRETDLLVVPSVWYENSPLTIHEALATRTPVVVSALGGMAELVRDGANGWTFPPGDARALAQVLGRVLRDRGELERLEFERAPARADGEKDMRAIAAVLEEHYRAALAERSGEGGAA